MTSETKLTYRRRAGRYFIVEALWPGDNKDAVSVTLSHHLGGPISRDAMMDAVDAIVEIFDRRYPAEPVSTPAPPPLSPADKELLEKLDKVIISVVKFDEDGEPHNSIKVSARTALCLQKGNIRYIGELVLHHTEAVLIKHKNFGRKSLKEITKVLTELGLRLGMADALAYLCWTPEGAAERNAERAADLEQ